MIKNATKKTLTQKNTKSGVVKEKASVGVGRKAVRKSNKGKKLKVKPTGKQKRAIELFIENPRKPRWQILKEAWYSKATQTHPKEVFEAEAVVDFFADNWRGMDNLRKKHNELLNSSTITRLSMPIDVSDEEVELFFREHLPWSKVIRIAVYSDLEKTVVLRVPNDKTQLSALDMAYKVLWIYKDPNAGTPPAPTGELSIRIEKANILFQLWTQQSPNNPSSPQTSSK